MALITISQNIGCGGNRIARALAEGLGIGLYDDRKLHDEAVGLGLGSEQLKMLDEKAPGFFGLLSQKPLIYLDMMEALVYKIAERGEGVIVGHGGQVLLKNFHCALHVRIHAPESTRIRRLAEERGLSADAAEKLVKKTDRQQQGFFQFAFDGDPGDPSLYDLIINTEKMNIETAARIIMEASKADEMATCSLAALEAMDRLALEREVHAALLRKGIDLNLLHIEVPEKGKALIGGFAMSRDDLELIVPTVKAVPGITQVKSEASFWRSTGV